jgi:hypothetical protein
MVACRMPCSWNCSQITAPARSFIDDLDATPARLTAD